jgi:hypothetical protein
MRGDGPDWLDADEGYTFLVLAAHEARRASCSYWAKGGPADRRYPVHASSYRPDDPTVIRSDIAERRQKRRSRDR